MEMAGQVLAGDINKMSLVQFQGSDNSTQLMQNSWAAQLNPLLINPLNQCEILTQVHLVIGANTIYHKLGKNLTGWFIVGQNALANIYDKQATNPNINSTLILQSDAVVQINLAVF